MLRRIFHLGRYSPSPKEEVSLELEHHLEQSTREFERQGLSPTEARRAALAAFGDRPAIEAELRGLRERTVRERQSREWWSEIRQDLRVACRGLWRTPAFTIVALLTLALGIGANSAIFSVVRSVLLRPLPYPESSRLVQLWADYRLNNGKADPEWLTPPDLAEWREGNRTFESIAAYDGWGPDLTGAGDPATLNGLKVGGEYFRALGVAPILGRTLLPTDDNPGAERAVVLSEGIWQRRFGGDPAIVGKAIQLAGEPWTVVGVMPRDFRAPLVGPQPEVFRPMRMPAESPCGRGCITLHALGRLKTGVTLQQAQADLAGISADAAARFPETNKGVGPWLVPLQEQITGPTREPLLALTGAIGFVLLIACVNLASLLLVRGEARSRELAVRAALGAGRGRLVRQLLAESAVLAGAGGLLGLGLGVGLGRVLSTIVPDTVRSIQQVRIDGDVVGFTLGLTLLSGILFGVLPAVQSAAGSLMVSLRGGGRAGGRGMQRMLRGLVVFELALAVMLLMGAGLLLRSFVRMQQVDLGYRTSGISEIVFTLPRARYPDSTVGTVMEGFMARLRTSQAVKSAELADVPPLSTGDQDVTAIALGEPQPQGPPGSAWYRKVSPGYRRAMEYQLLAGRDFTAEDRRGGLRVGMVNAELARRLWGSKNPLGRVLQLGRDSSAPQVTIVGVLASGRHDGPNAPYKGKLFLPIAQFPARAVAVMLEPAHDAGSALQAYRAALREVDPLLPVGDVQPIESLLRDSTARARLSASLIGGFAAVALLLAMLGVYGVMGYVVAQQSREIGVRMALGATPAGIGRMVLSEGGRLAALGIVVGLGSALALARFIRSLLFDTSVFDLQTLVGVPLLLAAVAVAACWLPARRALRLDPLGAIRAE